MPIYMHIEGIPGESQAEGHHNEFDIYAFSWGETNTRALGGGGGAGSGKVSMQDFHFTKPAGKSSPKLFLACASGRHLPAVQIVVTTLGNEREQNLQRYVLSDCIISSYQTGGDGDSRPTESLSLNFTKIEFSQWVFRDNGLAEGETA